MAFLVILAAGVLLTSGVVVYLVAIREQEGDTSLVVPDSGESATSMPEPIQVTGGTTQTRLVDGAVMVYVPAGDLLPADCCP